MSQIVVTDGGTVFEGQDAIMLFKAKVVRSGLRACQNGMRLNRAYTPKNLMAAATLFTNKKYKRLAYEEAIADLTQWIAAMEAALPIHDERKEKK